MSKKPQKKKTGRKSGANRAKQDAERYTAGEIAMAILGAAILVMVAGIVITSLLE